MSEMRLNQITAFLASMFLFFLIEIDTLYINEANDFPCLLILFDNNKRKPVLPP